MAEPIKLELEERLNNHWRDPRDIDCGKGIYERPPLFAVCPKIRKGGPWLVSLSLSDEIESLRIAVWNYKEMTEPIKLTLEDGSIVIGSVIDVDSGKGFEKATSRQSGGVRGGFQTLR